MKASALLRFTENVDYAYTMLCKPLLDEFDISQVSFDILMFLANNPE